MIAVKEIWQLAISPGVLPATILLVPVLLYWIIGALGVFSLDIDSVDPSAADAGAADGAHDGSGSHDGDGAHHDGVFGNIMSGMTRLVNAQDIPLMVVLTLIAIFFWSALMFAHLLLGESMPDWALAPISLAVAIILTRLASTPLRPFFLALRKDSDKHVPVIGRTGVVRTQELTERHGQVEVPDPIGPMLINARLKPGVEALKKGAEVIIFEYDPEHAIYFVKALS